MARISTIVALLVMLLWTSAVAQQSPIVLGLASKLTVEQAIDEGIGNNLGLLAERMNLTISEASLITARLRPNPLLSLGGDHINPANINDPPTELSFRIDVPIETGDKRERRMAVAEHDKSIAELRFRDAVRKLTSDVSEACVNLLQAKAQLQIALGSVRLLDQLVRLNEVRVQAGSVIPLELTRSRVSMFQFRSDVRRAELSLVAAKAKLQTLLGRKTVSDEFDILGGPKEAMPELGLELGSLVDLALATRPDIKALERQVERSQADFKLQLAQAKVDYLVGTEYRREGFHSGANLLGVFFTVQLPFFSRNQGEIARATAEREQLLRQLQARRLEVTVEVKTAYEEFRSARELVESIEQELLNGAEQARIISAYLYRTDASTLTDFLDTQRAYNETAQSYYEAQAATRRAAIHLNASVGKEVVPWSGTGLGNLDR